MWAMIEKLRISRGSCTRSNLAWIAENRDRDPCTSTIWAASRQFRLVHFWIQRRVEVTRAASTGSAARIAGRAFSRVLSARARRRSTDQRSRNEPRLEVGGLDEQKATRWESRIRRHESGAAGR